MPETFTFDVRASPSGQKSFRTLTAKFGDGYSQGAADGINNSEQSWTISVRGLLAPDCVMVPDVQAVFDFIDSHEGWKSFLWTPPIGVEGLYICQNYGMEKNAAVHTFNGTFVQVFR